MQDEGAVLIEVLPSQEYEDEHIAGAINIPLKRLNREIVSHLDKLFGVLRGASGLPPKAEING